MYHRGTISHSEHRPHFQSVLQSIIKNNIKISGNVITEFLHLFTRYKICHICFTFIDDSSSLMHSSSFFLETGTLSLHRWVLAIFLKFFVLALKTRKHLSDAKVARFPLAFAVTSEKGSIFAQATPLTHPLWSLNIFNFVPKKTKTVLYWLVEIRHGGFFHKN